MRLELDRLSLEIGGRRIVDDLCLTVAEGSVVGLLGPTAAANPPSCAASTAPSGPPPGG